MSKLLVFCDSNWADEMDLNGFKVVDQQEWEEHKKTIKEKFDKCDSGTGYEGVAQSCVGTNEEIYYESYNDWEEQFKEISITNEEADVVVKIFNLSFTYNDKIRCRDFGFFLDNPYFHGDD